MKTIFISAADQLRLCSNIMESHGTRDFEEASESLQFQYRQHYGREVELEFEEVLKEQIAEFDAEWNEED